MASERSTDRFHGRIHGAGRPCAYPRCHEAGEFRAPDPKGQAASANGPGDYQYLCLDHVRQFNAGYNWFAGMTADEISMAMSIRRPNGRTLKIRWMLSRPGSGRAPPKSGPMAIFCRVKTAKLCGR